MKKLFNMRPTLFIALSLCTGIAVAFFFMRKNIFWGIFLLSLFVIFSILYIVNFTDYKNKKQVKSHIILLSIFVIFFSLGSIGLVTRINAYENANLDGHYYFVTGKVKSVSFVNDGTKLILTDINVKGKTSGNLKYDASVYVKGECNLDIGDNISFSQNIRDNSYIYDDSFNANDIERRIKYTIKINGEDIIKNGRSLTMFEKVNLFIRDSLSKGLDEKEFTIAYALLTGNSKYMDMEVLSTYRMAGVAHIFAVSGLHIGFLASAVYFILRKIRIKPVYKTIITTLILLFYSGICGFSASSIRATIMSLVSLVAVEQGDRYDSLTAISTSAIIILLLSPVQLFCVGFQLSFMVVLGINLLSDPIKNLLRLPEKIGGFLSVVISAQLSSIPICIYAFGEFSLISVVVNIIFIPLVSVLFLFVLLSALIGGIFNISIYSLFIANYILKFVNMCIQAFDYSVFIVSGITLGISGIFYYLSMIFISGVINLKDIMLKSMTLMLSCLFVLTATIYSVTDFYTPKLYISNTESVCTTMLTNKDEASMIVSDVKYIYSDYNLTRLKNKTGIKTINKLVFMNGYPVDMQVFLTKFLCIFNVEKVYYYGEVNATQEMVIKKSFPDLELVNKVDNEEIILSDCAFNYELDGKILTGNISGKMAGIFSSEKRGTIYYTLLEKDFDLLIAMDNSENVLNYYKADKSISYRYSDKYIHAEGKGNIMVKVK